MLVIEYEGGWWPEKPTTYTRKKKFCWKELKFHYFVEECEWVHNAPHLETYRIRKKDYKRGSDHQMFRIYKKMNKVIKVS